MSGAFWSPLHPNHWQMDVCHQLHVTVIGLLLAWSACMTVYLYIHNMYMYLAMVVSEIQE